MSLVSAQIESIKHRFVQVDGIKMHIAAPSESLCKFKYVEFSGHASCDQPGQSRPTPAGKNGHAGIPAGHLRDFLGLHLIQELVNGRRQGRGELQIALFAQIGNHKRQVSLRFKCSYLKLAGSRAIDRNAG
jgi:hypothetical protein